MDYLENIYAKISVALARGVFWAQSSSDSEKGTSKISIMYIRQKCGEIARCSKLTSSVNKTFFSEIAVNLISLGLS